MDLDLRAVPPEVWAVALGLATTAACAMALARVMARVARSHRARTRAARAGEGEREAAGFLEAAGFEVEAAQATGGYDVEVDGEAVEVPLRADYLVRKDGRRWVAEVKTGGVAPRIRTPATRRQLLEYLVAFDVDGVLLVDAERGVVHDVRFPGTNVLPAPEVIATAPAPSSWLRGLALVLGGLAIGAVLGAAASQAAARASSPAASGTGAFGAAMPESTHLRAASSATGLTSAMQP